MYVCVRVACVLMEESARDGCKKDHRPVHHLKNCLPRPFVTRSYNESKQGALPLEIIIFNFSVALL